MTMRVAVALNAEVIAGKRGGVGRIRSREVRHLVHDGAGVVWPGAGVERQAQPDRSAGSDPSRCPSHVVTADVVQRAPDVVGAPLTPGAQVGKQVAEGSG